MFNSTKESYQLMRRIMDVQEELEKIRATSTNRTDKGRSSSKDLKVSPRTHKLSSQNRNGDFNDKKVSNFRLDTDPAPFENQIQVPKKSQSKGDLRHHRNYSQDNSESDDGKNNQEYYSKKPPAKPSSRNSGNLRDITNGINNENQQERRRPDRMVPRISLAEMNVGYRQNISFGNNNGTQNASPRISPYNKQNQAKTHLLSKVIPTGEAMPPAKDVYSQFLAKAHSLSYSQNTVDIENNGEKEFISKEHVTKEPLQLFFKENIQKDQAKKKIKEQSRTQREISPIPKEKTLSDHAKAVLEDAFKRKIELEEDNYPRERSLSNERRASRSAVPNCRKASEPGSITSGYPVKTKGSEERTTSSVSRTYQSNESTAFQSSQLDSAVTKVNMSIKENYCKINPFEDREYEKNKKEIQMNELKNKLQAKELEIMELKTSRSKHDIENQNLLLQIKEMIGESKKNEGVIESLKQQVSSQEKEIEFLKRCKTRLENNLFEQQNIPDTKDAFKLKKCETQLEEKNNEIRELKERLIGSQGEIKQAFNEKQAVMADSEKYKTEILLKDGEMARMKLEIEVYLNQIIQSDKALQNKLKDYSLIEHKILELEEMQDKLIEENNNLSNKLLLQTKPIKETDDFPMGKDVASQLLVTSKKLKDIEAYTKKLIKLLNSMIAGEEPSIETILKHNRETKDRGNPENELKALTLKQLNQQNMNLVEGLHKIIVQCMDNICDSYAAKYGNDCHVQ